MKIKCDFRNRGAEGGEEANLFARDLFEMYSSFASKGLEVRSAQQPTVGHGGLYLNHVHSKGW